MNGIVDYIFEMGLMKRRLISGFDQFTAQNRHTLASHAYRAAMIGMIIAEEEGANVAKVSMMLLVHENGETRVGDPDFLSSKYGIKKDESERKAFKEQVKNLPRKTGRLMYALFKEKQECETLEARIACDADILEHAFSAKEFLDQGVKGAEKWVHNVSRLLYTKTAKRLHKQMGGSDSCKWWKDLC